jgi:hypothetical protein
LLGAGCLTRYAFGWLVIPTLAFLLLFSGPRRLSVSLMTLAAFAVIVSPWIARNFHLSHTPFGTAGFAMYDSTPYFPENRLERSLNPDLSRSEFYFVAGKVVTNLKSILQDELPKFAGSWVGAFFLVGLMINFKNPKLSRLRYFILLCLPVLIVAEALGRTQLSETSPVINSENLLVLLAPPVIIFGVSLFFILLDQLRLPIPQLRYLLIGIFCCLICLPAILNFFSPRTNPIAYPPYHPPDIQRMADRMKENELIISDVPWAVAWYGQRQCLWLTLDAQSEFLDFNDYQKTISAIYLTPVTTDSRIFSQMVWVGDKSWGTFFLDRLIKKELPVDFPLRHEDASFLPDRLFLTDTEHAVQSAASTAASK